MPQGTRRSSLDALNRACYPSTVNTAPTQPINLQLRELAQLFNSMDPSPFQDRDLDADAEEFIMSWARELPPRSELELVIHLATPPPQERTVEVEQAVQHYFNERSMMKRREFRVLMRRGRTSLMVGLLFLGACLGLAEFVDKIGHSTLASLIEQSLTIGGWVAMWRPLEIYLYDWWPMRDEYRALDRLARMRVRLVGRSPIPGPAAPASGI